jgi:hypothetical protein
VSLPSADLVAAWPQTECRSLQARLRTFLSERMAQVRQQRAELSSFETQLAAVLRRLAARDPGPERCGQGCGCENDLDVGPARPEWGCSLAEDALSDRVDEWRALTKRAVTVERRVGEVRLVFAVDGPTLSTLAQLAAAETACCPHTRFTIEISSEGVVLTITAPGTPELLESLVVAPW